MADERLGASFSIDITQLQAGLKTANKLIRESQSEFKAAAAGLDDWRKSEEGLNARNQALTQQIGVQREKVNALKQNYQNLINQGLDPASDRAVQLRTQINNEEAALRKNEAELQKNTTALENLGDEAEETGKDAEKASEGFTVFKGVLANLATEGIKMALNGLKSMGAALVNVGKQAIESYADYEQLVGGVETLFGAGGQSLEEYAKSIGKSVKDAESEYNNLMTAQNNMIENANNAYKTAGMSANEYMSNVTGFSASLISSLDGDTVKAAAAADRAMTDISDNANKMGTDMQSIVDTYQSLARGNYQMLDNLKLGYGGTKSEMERMIADANAVKKANGEMANLSVDSFADVTEAIHIIQNEMGITGTTSKEASTTIQGSIGMMKSSWQNLLTGMADETMDFDQLITNFIDSIKAVAENLIPRIKVVMNGIINLVASLLPNIPPLLQDILPDLISGVKDLATGLTKILPDVIDILINQLLPLLVTSIIELLPTLLSTLIEVTIGIINGISEMLPQIVNAIMEVLPLLISILTSGETIGQLLDAAITLLMAIVEAIPTIVNALYGAMPDIINQIISSLISALPQIINGAITLFMGIVQAIPKMLPTLISYLPRVIKAIFDALTSPASINSLKQAGSDLIKGLWNGISDMAGWIGEKIRGFGSGVLNSLKSFFGIASPSKVMRDQVGKNIALGIIKGVDSEKKNAQKSAAELSKIYVDAAKAKVKSLKEQNKITVADEVAMWNEILKAAQKGSDGYKTAQKELASSQKSYREQLQKDIKAIVDEYDKAIADRKKDLLGQFNLFEAVEDREHFIDPKGMIKNLKTQVEALEDYNFVMGELEKRGVPKELMEEFRGMGVENLDQLESIDNLTDEQFKQYVNLWKKRNKLAQEQAEHENESLLASSKKKIKALTSELATLGVSAENESKTIGENIVAGLEKGIKSKNKEFQAYLKTFFASITKQAQKSLKIHSPSLVMKDLIGKNIALGIVEGFDENIKGLRASVNDINGDLTRSVDFGMNKTGTTTKSVVINQTNHYSQAHSRYELYKSKQQTAAAVRLALGTV